MAFRFPLQTLLRLRETLEHQEELRLQEAQKCVTRLQIEMQSLEKDLVDLAADEKRELSSGLTAAELQFGVLRRLLLLAERSRLQDQLAEAERLRDLSKDALNHARQQRQIVERLRTRQLEIYLRQQVRQEQARADDLFLMRRAVRRPS